MNIPRDARRTMTARLFLPAALYLLFGVIAALRAGRWIPWESARIQIAQRLYRGDLCWIIPRSDDGLLPYGWLDLLSMKVAAIVTGGAQHALALLLPNLVCGALALIALSVFVARVSTPTRGMIAGLLALSTPTVLFSALSLTATATVWAPLTFVAVAILWNVATPNAAPTRRRAAAIGLTWGLAIAGAGWIGVFAPLLLLIFVGGFDDEARSAVADARIAEPAAGSAAAGSTAPSATERERGHSRRTSLQNVAITAGVLLAIIALPAGTLLRNEGFAALASHLTLVPFNAAETPFAFDHALRQIVFLCFPLITLVPLLATLPRGGGGARQALRLDGIAIDSGRAPAPAVGLWAVAILCASVPVQVLGSVLIAPLALPLAAWAALRWPLGEDAAAGVSVLERPTSRAPYYGLFVAVVAVFVLLRDLKGDASVEGASSSPFLLFEALMPYADDATRLAVTLPGVTGFCALLLLALLITTVPRRFGFPQVVRFGWQSLLVLVVFWSALASQAYYPRISALLSLREPVAALAQEWQQGDRVLSFGLPPLHGEPFLDGVSLERAASLDAIETAWCHATERLFVVLPPTDLANFVPNLRRRARFRALDCPSGGALHALHAGSTRFAVISNQPATQFSPVESYFDNRLYASAQELPSDVRAVEAFSAGRQLGLVGYRVHRSIRRFGTTLHVETYWRVEAVPPRQLEAFVHVESPAKRLRRRFDPSRGQLPTHRWLVGDIVRVDERIKVPSLKDGESYRILVGFETGGQRVTIYPTQPFDRIALPWDGQ